MLRRRGTNYIFRMFFQNDALKHKKNWRLMDGTRGEDEGWKYSEMGIDGRNIKKKDTRKIANLMVAGRGGGPGNK